MLIMPRMFFGMTTLGNCLLLAGGLISPDRSFEKFNLKTGETEELEVPLDEMVFCHLFSISNL